ncbi:MAG TPA: hypothetical protein VMT61_00765 [Candidatus Binataceae bacterium]|nr:hypothetical protein [Candidatus Binataceae bacterium]
MTKVAKAAVLTLGLSMATGLALPAFAQDAPAASGAAAPATAAAAPSGATKEQVQEEMPKVARHLWDAKLSSVHNAQMNQAWKAAQAAYAKGDYDKAMAKLKIADELATSTPNVH